MPGITILRLLRGLRIVRIFARLKSLRQIIQALYKAIPSMSNAFCIVCVVMGLYSVLATQFFAFVEVPQP